jgi:phosphoribosylformylglycinamidine cyclo-ligase
MLQSSEPMTYAQAGVDYTALDPTKLFGQTLASQTVGNTEWLNVFPQEQFRGESAYIIKIPGGHLGHVEEGLGTKILMADTLFRLTGSAHGYHVISQDTISMIVNDMATLGVPPISVQMHLGVGSGEWPKEQARVEQLMQGWKDGCLDCGAVWTGGETPALKGIIDPESAVLAGSAMGYLPEPYLPFEEKIQAGDAIIGIASSGVHANGISLVREIGALLNQAEMLDLYNEALVPTVNYARLINEMIRREITPSYAIHVTGHGWRKMMRAKRPFTYHITKTLSAHPIFAHIQSLGNVAKDEMWGTGFVLIVRPEVVGDVLLAAENTGYIAKKIGVVQDGTKQVVIDPVGVVFSDKDMQLRA